MKRSCISLAGFLAMMFFASWTLLSLSKDRILVAVNKTEVLHDSILQLVYFTCGMNIDADGSPRAYHPNDTSGLDKLAYAGKKGNWWGIVTDNKGEPVVQGKDDPYPGYYISTTSLEDPSKKIIDPKRYVNSEEVPYFVLPNNKTLFTLIKKGDIARIENLRN